VNRSKRSGQLTLALSLEHILLIEPFILFLFLYDLLSYLRLVSTNC
jgi:hypothetical protein